MKSIRMTVLQVLIAIPEPLTVSGLRLRMGEVKGLQDKLDALVRAGHVVRYADGTFAITNSGHAYYVAQEATP